MMFGTVMMANSTTSSSNNTDNQQHHVTSNTTSSNLLSSKYQQELIDNELMENANSILKKTYQRSNANNGGQVKLNPAALAATGGKYGITQQLVYDKIQENQCDNMYGNNEQKIQVQILPQDDWAAADGANTTAMTADFSDFGDDLATEDGRSSQYGGRRYDYDEEKLAKMSGDEPKSMLGKLRYCLKRQFGFMFTVGVLIVSLLTPILFILLPRIIVAFDADAQQFYSPQAACGIECEGIMIGVAFKLFILTLGTWAIYARRPRNLMPKWNELRTLIVFFLLIMTFSFWLFYGCRILDQHQLLTNSSGSPLPLDYYKILQFSSTYVDCMLFVYILSVIIIELRHMRTEYLVTVYRSPDGEQKTYAIGRMSIQRAALWILENYYTDFKPYNPWLRAARQKRAVQLMQLQQQSRQRAGSRRGGAGGNITAMSSASTAMMGNDPNLDAQSTISFKTKPVVASSLSAGDRLFEESEFEKRVKKREARLICVTEEAFSHVKRVHDTNAQQTNENGTEPAIMDPYETAQAIFSTIARDLRRYLRVTRQQMLYSRESIVAHLAQCVSYDISPKTFLQRYMKGDSLGVSDKALTFSNMPIGFKPQHQQTLTDPNAHQNWILICESVLYQNIQDSLLVVLKQNEVSLMCEFKRLPRFNLIEDILDPKRNKFLIKLNSETTV